MHANKEIIKKLHPCSVSKSPYVSVLAPSRSANNFVLQSFCLWLRTLPPAPLTSIPPWAISANRQASHLSEPQQLSRVVKVRQASERAALSSLDVKVSPLWTEVASI